VSAKGPGSEGEEAVGLLAGGGLLPINFARSARAHGMRVVGIGIKGEASDELARHVDELHWTGANQLGHWIRIFKRAGVAHVVICGSVNKANMYRHPTAFIPDLRAAKMWYSRLLGSRQDHTLLEGLIREFESEGIAVESCIRYCPELLVRRGCLTRRKPTAREWADIRFAWPIAKQIAAMQIGQTVVVKDKAVVAVEGMDGTDATLRRGAEIAGGNVVAVKVAKEGHDLRYDIPCIGPTTARVIAEAGVRVLAMEAGTTVMLEREEVVRIANGAGASVLAVTAEDCEGS